MPWDGPGFWRGALLILLLCAAAYVTVLRPGAGFVWDDVAITENRVVLAPSGLADIWFRPLENTHEEHYWPLVYTTFWLEHKLWGLRAPLFHAANVLLHAANCLLIWSLLQRLKVPGSWLAAVLFAVHPVHAESVAWVIERKDVLSGLFYLLAFHAHLSFADGGERRRQILAVVFYAAGLLSKSVVVTLPAALLVALWWRGGTLTRRNLLGLLPMAGVGAVIVLADILYVRAFHPPLFQVPLAERLLVVPRAFWFYLGKLLWPAEQMAIYPRWPISTEVAAGLAALAGLIMIAAILSLFQKGLGRGPLAALLFYFVTLAPTLGFVTFGFMRYSYVADRYQYLASLGPLALAAGTAAVLADRSRIPLRVLQAVGFVVVAVLAVLTARHAYAYGEPEVLWSRNIDLNEKAWEPRQQLGRMLADRGIAENNGEVAARGIRLLEDSIRMNPGFFEAHYNLGTAYHALGHHAQAEHHFRRALELNPDYFLAYNGLAAVMAETGRLAEAIPLFEKTLEYDSYHSEAAENLRLAREQLSERE